MYNVVLVGDDLYALYLMHETRQHRKEGRHNGQVIALRVTDTGDPPFLPAQRMVLEYVFTPGTRNIEGVASLYQGGNKAVTSCSISQHLVEELAVPCSVESALRFHPEVLTYLKGWQRYG